MKKGFCDLVGQDFDFFSPPTHVLSCLNEGYKKGEQDE